MAKQMTPEEAADYIRISEAMVQERKKSLAKKGIIHMIVGLFWFVLGMIITICSYCAVGAGGVYLIAFGVILGGIIEFIVGTKAWLENKN